MYRINELTTDSYIHSTLNATACLVRSPPSQQSRQFGGNAEKGRE